MTPVNPAPTLSVESCLTKIEAQNQNFNAMITPMPNAARAQITAGLPLGPLFGMAISVKDNLDTAGTRTTRGSAFFDNHVPNTDSTVVQRLKAAGAVIVGKDNMHEFAFGGTTQNPHFGLGHNPWNVAAIPGGSSGGSGISVAAGFAEAALGTDTGGSVRIPAALNGISGLRPTVGRVPNTMSFPVSARMDTIGPLARSVATVGDVYEVIAGYDPADPSSVERPVQSWRSCIAAGFGELRAGIPVSLMEAESTPEVITLVRNAAEVLRQVGLTIDDMELRTMTPINEAYTHLVQADAATVHCKRLETRPESFGIDVLQRLEIGAGRPIQDYAAAHYTQVEWKHELASTFSAYDLLIMPTVGFGAPLASDTWDMTDMTHRLTRMTAPWSLAELPGISMPCGFTVDGLPVGLQIIGPKWSEATLIAVGVTYQAKTKFHLQWPPTTTGSGP